MFTPFFLRLVQWFGLLPLSWVRALGVVLGWLLYATVASRRNVVKTNLKLCFPQLASDALRQRTVQTFIHFAQAWLDRGWLWHGPAEHIRIRLKLVGAVHELDGDTPTVIFAPHFMGLDAAWTALTQQIPRRFATIYSPQLNPAVDAWILAGRQRFGGPELVPRLAGAKPIVAALRNGEPLYLLPDMNFDPRDSLWVPFYGMSTATVPSLSRFAKLGRAKVVPVIARMQPWGYEIEVMPAWTDFPGEDLAADTALMNLRLQGYIDAMPAQYYWVHKRFKDRPDGESPPY